MASKCTSEGLTKKDNSRGAHLINLPSTSPLMQKDKGSVHVSGLILTGRSVQWVIDEVSNESTKAPTRNENSWTVR